MSLSTPARRTRRVRHELKRRDVEVVSVEPIGAHFVAVTFADASLGDFVSDSFDDHVKFIFTDPASGEPVRRDYTPRRFDRAAGTLTIEFALHGSGPAADWVRRARIGQRATMGGPRGSMVVPIDYAWHLLVGDASALPAIDRRIEELPAGTPTVVVAQVADAAARRALDGPSRPEVHWVADADAMLATVRGLALPAGEGFVWAAGEASAMARLRTLLLDERSHPREAMRVAAYWRHGATGFHEALDG
jgi:NADPH-dependent ferric siderophore reductase